MENTGEERLQKALARLGVASRRSSEGLILSGRIKVNGEVVNKLGSKVILGRDIISLDDTELKSLPPFKYILLNKPPGWITSLKDEKGRRTVLSLLKGVEERVYPVGRLDYATSGLLLFTNDGELTNNLLHPSKEIEKTYLAGVKGDFNPKDLDRLKQGILLEDGMTAAAKAKILKKYAKSTLVEITIHEGKNRQIRRMLEALGYDIMHLKRTGFAFLRLDGLPLAGWRYLLDEEINGLKAIGRAKKPAGNKKPPARGNKYGKQA